MAFIPAKVPHQFPHLGVSEVTVLDGDEQQIENEDYAAHHPVVKDCDHSIHLCGYAKGYVKITR